MFRETIVHSGGTTEGSASEQHALLLLQRAAKRGYGIEATTDGGALITWLAHRLNATIPLARSITLTPHCPAGRALTPATVEDLRLISEGRGRYETRDGQLVITGGIWRIPPAATARLRARTLITADGGHRVRLTLVSRLALLAREHRTTTTEPDGWQRPADTGAASAGLNRPGRRAGLLRSPASTATCECGFRAVGGDRPEARRLAAAHRSDVATGFVRALDRNEDASHLDSYPFPGVTLREHPGAGPFGSTWSVYQAGWRYGGVYKTHPGALRAAERASKETTSH